MNMGKSICFLFCLAAAGLVFSCTGFFSTSLATWAARDPNAVLPPVTTGNVTDLISSSENNPDMSLAVLKKIKDAVDNASPETASSLQAAALQAAANASNMGPTLLNKVANISDVTDNMDDAKQLVIDTINEMSNLSETSSTLTAVLPEPGTPSFDAFIEKANADDLATAAAVLIAAEAKGKVDGDEFINNFDPANPDLSSSAVLAIELAKAASQKYENGSSGSRLKDIIAGLNLIP
ncbi:MAG: hypothetical protein LBL28_00300 [Treponema sp.]|jgi:hypothetical protein|nr:hypothetical protein [Treponema sp.]